MPDLCSFQLEFENSIVIIEISTLNFCLLAKFREKKFSEFGRKNSWFEYFWAGIWKQHCYIWNQHPRICLIPKFVEKIKMPKFGTKNALFGYFGARVLKNYCHIWNQRPQTCLTAKLWEKIKMPKFGTKNALFWYFWASILKTYCNLWN